MAINLAKPKPAARSAAARIASIDLWYGIFAGAVVVIGFSRAIFAATGWAFYSHNTYFWAKLICFAAVGLLSLPPTFALIRWRKSAAAPDDSDIRSVRR